MELNFFSLGFLSNQTGTRKKERKKKKLPDLAGRSGKDVENELIETVAEVRGIAYGTNTKKNPINASHISPSRYLWLFRFDGPEFTMTTITVHNSCFFYYYFFFFSHSKKKKIYTKKDNK